MEIILPNLIKDNKLKTGYGIYYRGSKSRIVKNIAKFFPKAENFYDLFGGGFAVSHYILLNAPSFKRVFFNEIKSDVVDFIRDAISGYYNFGVFEPKWVSREEFHRDKKTSAYKRIMWSFCCNQTTYMYGKRNEALAESMHNAICFNFFNDTAKDILKMDSFPEMVPIRERLSVFRKLVTNVALKSCERFFSGRLQALSELSTDRIYFSSKSYDEVEILPNSIIYCDPPYKDTGGYGDTFDHTRFWQWVLKNKNPVFVSEKDAPSDAILLTGIPLWHQGRSGSSVHITEKLFCNSAARELLC